MIKQMKIGDFDIGRGRVFIIAEIGNNHNGNFELAIKLIDLAISSGADAVKFQMRNIENLYRRKSLDRLDNDLGTEYIIDLLYKFELSIDDQKKLKKYCDDRNILYLCTPWDEQSVYTLETMNVLAYKVASADLTNTRLLEKISQTKKPMIISTGMSTLDEIRQVVNYLNCENARFIILHCNSTYPAPFHDINLKLIHTLKKIHPLVGYSGHERGISVSLAAVALGACVLERHFTVNRDMEGPDHSASLEPCDFSKLVQDIRDIEQAFGNEKTRLISQGEMINRENLAKSLVASKNLVRGHVIKSSDIDIKSPGKGLSPSFYNTLIGKKIYRDIGKEDFFFMSDIDNNYHKPKKYKFSRPWGIPVRFHDFKRFSEIVCPDLFEFHLSYSDMELNLDLFLDKQQKTNFTVHAPELLKGSILLDLATPDDEIRKYSIKETQRVINITRRLKTFFPTVQKPMIIVNIGGFTRDQPLDKSKISEYYLRFGESLEILDLDGVELIPQTMAPFPWHYGGQRFQNLFINADEIIKWCKIFSLRMCYDVSHSKLACNFLNISFDEFSSKIGPYTAHIHLGDAYGFNGEGLQIGDGEINFKKLGKLLGTHCPNASFIPEIWQGHKNEGEGFWIALERLENKI
jgi:sialic acid synthase SpsE/sugar phosphate isomerase/epimerase